MFVFVERERERDLIELIELIKLELEFYIERNNRNLNQLFLHLFAFCTLQFAICNLEIRLMNL